MGDKQIAAMEPSVAEVYAGITSPDQPPAKCCNMCYPFTGDPLELLRNQCVDTRRAST